MARPLLCKIHKNEGRRDRARAKYCFLLADHAAAKQFLLVCGKNPPAWEDEDCAKRMQQQMFNVTRRNGRITVLHSQDVSFKIKPYKYLRLMDISGSLALIVDLVTDRTIAKVLPKLLD